VIQINIGDHISSEPGWIAVPGSLGRIDKIRWSRQRAFRITREIPFANTYFRGLPNRRSLTDLLNDGGIWINYDPVTVGFGATNFVGGNEIAIGDIAFRLGQWSVLATLIHELAHVNGAPGGSDKLAEGAVLACGLGRLTERVSGVDDLSTPYNPGIGG